MSDEQGRPLTRRQLREREGWVAADGDNPPTDLDTHSEEFERALVAESVPVTTTSSIPVIGPDGKILSRRELRELWAAEEAAAAAAAAAASEAETEAEQSASNAPEIDESPAEQSAHEEVDQPAPQPTSAESDSLEPDEANSVSTEDGDADPSIDSEISDQTDEPNLELDTAADVDGDVIDEVTSEHPPLPAPEHKGGGFFPWSRKKKHPDSSNPEASPSSESSTEHEADVETELLADETPAILAASAVVASEEVIEAVVEEPAEVEPQSESDSDIAETEEADAAGTDTPEAETEPTIQPYTFPEVSPDPESRSIFEHHTTGTIGFVPSTEVVDPSETGAFDDIITRAVADEGAASPTNTASLILPTLPDTTDVSGALNETGEIVITGSIELPKTLGETGGHIALHDTLDPHEAAVLGHELHELEIETPNDTQPVSALKAVSAQDSNNAIVSPISKRDSKLPLILAISASGLVVVVAGVFIWAASTGLFG